MGEQVERASHVVIANIPLESVSNKVNLLGRGVVLQGATIYIFNSITLYSPCIIVHVRGSFNKQLPTAHNFNICPYQNEILTVVSRDSYEFGHKPMCINHSCYGNYGCHGD